MIEKIVAEQKIINKGQLERLEENKKMIATGAIVALGIVFIGGTWYHFQNKKIQSHLEQQQGEQQQRVTRTKVQKLYDEVLRELTEVIRDPNGRAIFREAMTDERPVGENQNTADTENTMLLALREFPRPVDQGEGQNILLKPIIVFQNLK